MNIEKFLIEAFRYLKNYGELSQKQREKMNEKTRSNRRVLEIMMDPQKFMDVYDVFQDEAVYYELNTEEILRNLSNPQYVINIYLDYFQEQFKMKMLHSSKEEIYFSSGLIVTIAEVVYFLRTFLHSKEFTEEILSYICNPDNIENMAEQVNIGDSFAMDYDYLYDTLLEMI